MKTHQILIRKATPADIEEILRIYDRARQFMRKTGNIHQWTHGYPDHQQIEKDIAESHLYVFEHPSSPQAADASEPSLTMEAAAKTPFQQLAGAFCFMPGPDPTYRQIEDGHWKSEEPYHVIHRLGSDGSMSGLARACFAWCEQQLAAKATALPEDKGGRGYSLRVDTHHDNRVMQKILEDYGFQRCGIIHLADGSPRIAYQK